MVTASGTKLRSSGQRKSDTIRRAASRGVSGKHSASKGAGSNRKDSTRSSSRRNKKKSLFRTSKPLRYLTMLLAGLLLAMVVICVADIVANIGKIHRGVSVAGIDVGGMTQAEAAEILERELTYRIEAAPIEISCEQVSLRRLLDITRNNSMIELDINLQDASGRGQDPLKADSWLIRPLTVTASIDGEALAAQAFAVGRSDNPVVGRLQAWLKGVELPGFLEYDEQQFYGLIQLLDQALGTPIVNADIAFKDGSFAIIQSAEGIGVDEQQFILELNNAFLSGNRTADVPLVNQKPQITDATAQELADRCNAAIADSVLLVGDNGMDWQMDSQHIGLWLVTEIIEDDAGVQLVVMVSPEKMKQGLIDVLAGYDPGLSPSDASFSVATGDLTIIPSEQGRGIDYSKLAVDLEQILFGSAEGTRQMQLSVTILNPAFSTADAEALRITDRISSYSTNYGWSSPARANNIEVAAGYVTHSLIAPGQIWSFNQASGDATIERGYQVSKVISGNEYEDAVGGGVCQVATTVFNAVFDAGYPIVARANHGLFQSQYAVGRDAAVYYPWLDMKWENDTDSWILLTVTCCEGRVTATLWGTNPGYRVESQVGSRISVDPFKTEREPNDEMEIGEEKVVTEGEDAWTVTVVRRVYDANGTLIRESTFKSTYQAITEVVEFGTKPPERPPEPEPLPVVPPDQDDDTGEP